MQVTVINRTGYTIVLPPPIDQALTGGETNIWTKIDPQLMADNKDAWESLAALITYTTAVDPDIPDALEQSVIAEYATTLATHHTRHENGGGDEIDVTGLPGLLADAQTPDTHAAAHELAGGDLLSVAGLAGALADPQVPTAHAASHQTGQPDEIDVTGLAGETGTPQPVKDETVSVDKLAVEDADDYGTVAVLRVEFAAGVGGAADDVTIYTANSPYQMRIIDAWVDIVANVGGATVHLNDAAGGAGNAYTSNLSAAAAATVRNADLPAYAANAQVLPLASDLFIRRSDSGVGGTFFILIEKI